MDVVGLHRNNISKDYQERGFDECLTSISQRLHCLIIFVRTFSRKHSYLRWNRFRSLFAQLNKIA